MGNEDIKREEFKQWLKSNGYTSIRHLAKDMLHYFNSQDDIEVKRLYFASAKRSIEDNFGSSVTKDVFFIIGKIHKEEKRIEEAIINDKEDVSEAAYDEYEKMCDVYDKYDLDERKAMKSGRRNLDFYDGHINDIEDYNIGFEDDIKVYNPARISTRKIVRRKLKKFTD